MHSLKILYLTQVRLDRPYGGARHVLAVANEVAKLGHGVTLIAPGMAPHLEPGVRHLRTPSIEPGGALELALAGLAGAAMVEESFDLAYIRLSSSSSLAPLVVARAGVPYLAELNGPILDEMTRLGRSRAQVSIVRFNLRRVLKRAAGLIVPEPAFGRHAEVELGAQEVHWIENGADLDVARPGSRSEARRALGAHDGDRLISFAGTLSPNVRLDLLTRVAERRPDLRWIVVGDGPASGVLKTMHGAMSERVKWLGARPHAEAILALRAADICVNLRSEWVGMKPFEYAAVGRRFANPRVEGAERLHRLYPGLEAVHLYEPTADSLERALDDALAIEEARGSLPAEAVEAARSEVSWTHTVRRILDLAGRVAEHGGGEDRGDR